VRSCRRRSPISPRTFRVTPVRARRKRRVRPRVAHRSDGGSWELEVSRLIRRQAEQVAHALGCDCRWPSRGKAARQASVPTPALCSAVSTTPTSKPRRTAAQAAHRASLDASRLRRATPSSKNMLSKLTAYAPAAQRDPTTPETGRRAELDRGCCSVAERVTSSSLPLRSTVRTKQESAPPAIEPP